MTNKSLYIKNIISNYIRHKLTGLPNTANYDITGKCNSNCSHCYFKKHWTNNEELTSSQWNNIFENHYSIGIKNAFLTGGEPTLRYDVVEKADKIFDNVWIVSNGIYKIPQNLDRRIFISIDGNEQIHNSIRRVNSFSTIMKNINNDKRVILSPTLSTLNYQQIDNLVKIAIEQNVFGITFSLYTGNSLDDDLVLRGAQLEYTVNKMREVIKDNKDIILLTDKMAKNFYEKKHIKNCFLRSRWVISFYPNLKMKTPCVLGENVDCRTCGCIVPIMLNSISNKFDLAALDVIKRMYPSHASSVL